jgi:hypothetical protein
LTAVTEESDKPATLPRLEFGPAMRSLRPQQQRAILSLFQTEGNRTQAMKLAGYGKTSHKSVESHASAFSAMSVFVPLFVRLPSMRLRSASQNFWR